MQSLAMLIPAALLTEANALGDALGYGPENFTIPCGDGETVTHYAGYLANADAFVAVLEAAAQGNLPDGIVPEQVASVLAALITDATESDDTYGHMTAVLEGLSLQRMG